MEISTNDLQELTSFNQEEDFVSQERLEKISVSSLINLQKSTINNGYRSFSNLLPRSGASGGQKSPVKSLIEHQKPLKQKDDDSITEKLNAISGNSRSLPNFSSRGSKTRSFSTLLQRNDKSTISIHGKISSEIPQITITNTDSKVTKAIAHEEEPLNEKLEAISTSGSTYKKPFKTSAGNRNFATLLKSNDKHSSDTKTDDVESKNGSKLDSTIGKN